MIIIKWGKLVSDPYQLSYISYTVLGKIYGIDGSTARRLVLKRMVELNKK